MDLRDIIDLDKFQIIQDDIAMATDMAIITVDYKGIPVTKHSRCTEFCNKIRGIPEYNELCEKCDSRGGIEAVRLEQPYIYRCHADLVDFAIPIIVEGDYLGAVMAGQVLVDKGDKEKLELIVNEKQFSINLNRDFKILYENLPIMKLDKIKSISRLMFHLTNYIAEEALLKTSMERLIKTRESRTRNSHIDIQDDDIHVKGEDDGKENFIECKNRILKPAIEYINNNYTENLTLAKVASISNISTSYFSKLFRKEFNMSLPNYINRIRVEKAKELLKGSDMPIINISLNLGFTDCGYFIKVFKDFVKLTPNAYRREIKYNK